MARNEPASNISEENAVSITRLQVATAILSKEQWNVTYICVNLRSSGRASKSVVECFCHAADLCISCVDEGWLLILPISIRE